MSGWGPFEQGRATASLIRWDKADEPAYLAAQVEGEECGEVVAKLSTRCLLRWNKKGIRAGQMRQHIPIIPFLPAHMALVEGSASNRRRLLDTVGALINPLYAIYLHQYRKLVYQKSLLLRRGVDAHLVERAIEPLAIWLWQVRDECVRLLKQGMEYVKDLLPSQIDIFFIPGGGGDAKDLRENYLMARAEHSPKERLAKSVLVGPHRDDVKLLAADRPAVQAFSRGHRRRVAFALAVAAAWSVHLRTGKKPILLLDEITAELDEEGRRILFDGLVKTGWQVFATTAELGTGAAFFSRYASSAVYHIQEGLIRS